MKTNWARLGASMRVRRALFRAGIDVRRVTTMTTQLAQLKTMIEHHRIDTVIDVGANVGQFASSLREVGFRGRIHSFEPASSTFARLEVAAANDPLWSVHRLALGAAEGVARLNVSVASEFTSFRATNAFAAARFPGVQETRVEEVRVTTLEAVAAEQAGAFGDRWFLKVDTQGFDLEVFAGARGVLDKVVCLVSELSFVPIYDGAPTYLEALETYAAAGFAPSGFHIVTRTGDLVAIEMDCFMVNAARVGVGT